MKGKWAIASGTAVGAGIVFPLILYLFSRYSINRNNAAIAMPVYMQHSVNLKITFPQKTDIHNRRIAIRYKKNGNNDLEITDQEFYLPAFKKHFIYEQFDQDIEQTLQGDELNNQEVIMRVNKDDLANPKLGTKQNPVIVFNVWPAAPLMMKNEKTGNIDTLYPNFNQNNYKYNLRMYLTYIMSKEEFKKRFGK